MSFPVSGAPTFIQNAGRHSTYCSANFHPSIWGDHFLSYADDSMGTIDDGSAKHLVLKEEIRKMLTADSNKPSEKLYLIDAIQRLGVSYHFESEIDNILDKLNETGVDESGDLNYMSLQFRLLRQNGYKISADVFNKFKDSAGYFKSSLVKDVRGMLSLYEATHLRVHGENILDEALAFTTSHLELMATQISPLLAAQVKHALKQPIRKGLQRLEAKRYMPFYQEGASHNEALLTFAKLDFNKLQKLHQKELSDITRWDISAIEQLPEYMKLCYGALLNVYSEIEKYLANEGKLYRLHYEKEAMKKIVQSYFLEAKWCHQNYIPPMDEYMPVVLVTTGYPMLTTMSFVGMGDIVTKESFEWLLGNPKMIRASSIVNRLMDDMVPHKVEQSKEHVTSSIKCYMKQ